MTISQSPTSRFLLKSAAISSIVLLSACGGNGTASRGETYSDFADEYGVLLDNPAFDGDRNDPASLPSSGSVTYNGVMSMFISEGTALTPDSRLFILGDMRMTANFGTDDFEGDIVELVDTNQDTYTGSIDIVADIFNDASPTEAVVFGSADGSFRNDRTDDLFQINGLDGDDEGYFVADFFGPNEQFIRANIRGELVTPDETLLLWDNDGAGEPDGNVYLFGER